VFARGHFTKQYSVPEIPVSSVSTWKSEYTDEVNQKQFKPKVTYSGLCDNKFFCHTTYYHDYHNTCIVYKYLLMLFRAQVLRVCRTSGPTACLKMLYKVCLKIYRKKILMYIL